MQEFGTDTDHFSKKGTHGALALWETGKEAPKQNVDAAALSVKWRQVSARVKWLGLHFRLEGGDFNLA